MSCVVHYALLVGGSCSKVGSSEKVFMMNGIENVRDTGPKRRGSEFEKMVSGEEYNWTDPELMERKEILTPRLLLNTAASGNIG
jgi:hypothetical protein